MFKIEQIYTGCLAQGAYYIESKGEVAIIDPLREVEPYIQRARRDNSTIKYIFETHFHADFVSGHVELGKKTGAPIIYGPTAKPEFEAVIATDGQIFSLGDITIRVLHTPGHTIESCCYLLLDESGAPHSLFSGDTLFLGDVGRPDLAQANTGISAHDLAGMLYDSIRAKILPLPDSVIVYPAHGAGSACGKNMMKETVDTLGHQKQMNYALKQPDRESFIAEVLDGLLPPPAYFPMNVELNRKGSADVENVVDNSKKEFTPDEFERVAEVSDALVLDVRPPKEFAKGFIPRSVNIGLEGQFAPWVGALIADVKQPLLLVTEVGREQETAVRLARVGFDNVLGHLKGGFENWKNSGKEIDTVDRITAAEFKAETSTGDHTIIDVRKESEFAGGHLENAENKPLDVINEWFLSVSDDKPFYLHCASGYRSMMAASILKNHGIHNFREVGGGIKAIREAGVHVVNSVS